MQGRGATNEGRAQVPAELGGDELVVRSDEAEQRVETEEGAVDGADARPDAE